MKLLLVLGVAMLLSACGTLTGYNVKTSVGHTEYDNGERALFTGASVDMRFDVK